METSLYVATSATRIFEKQLDLVANNVANSSTVGFRSESLEFKSLVSTTHPQHVHYPTISKTINPSHQQGGQIETGNPFDISINGDGWFAIATPRGTAYTRAGQLQLSPTGELQTLEGNQLLDLGEAPIQLDVKKSPPVIHGDGRIEVDGKVVSSIGVFDIQNDTISGRYTNTSFFTTVSPPAISAGKNTVVNQGFLEASNVDPMRELANLISVTRAFESTSKLIEKADSTITQALGELSGR